MMRERFDRIEIIDLRGDVNAGPRGDVVGDQGVFNIKVGTAITVCIADGSKADGALAEVSYLDAWEKDQFARRAKLDWLAGGSETGSLPDAVAMDRGLLDDFRPKPFQNGEWLSIREAFAFVGNGTQSKRDAFAYDVSKLALEERLTVMTAEPKDQETAKRAAQAAEQVFRSTSTRPLENARARLRVRRKAKDPKLITASSYRPLDIRQFCNEEAVLDRPRPKLRATWGLSNFALYTLPSGIGLGPAVWLHSSLPDYHSFRGSYGGYAFPLYDRRAGPDAANLNPALIAGLSAAYGAPVAPEDSFDAILALLSATSYTRTFAEDLEDVFPHIPFPATRAIFDQAVAIGREIRAVEGFTRPAEARFRPLAFFRLRSESSGPLATGIEPSDGELTLCADGSGKVSGVAEAVWSFAVSGYRVLPRWIEARAGLPAEGVWPELRDVAARIAELIHRFDEADLVLTATLADSLRREALGFPDADPEAADEGDD